MELKFNVQQALEVIVRGVVKEGRIQSRNTPDFAAQRGGKPMIIVAAAPRTGSTFLANVIKQLTQLPYFRLCYAYATNEHDLYLPAMCMINSSGCVSQLHIKGSFHNAALMRAFGVKPIILTRRIMDIVVSLKGDLRKKEKRKDFGSGLNGYSFLWQDQATAQLDDARLLDLIIDLAVPWFVNFYVSWHRLQQQGAVEGLWITYEELMADKEKTVRDILNFVGGRIVSDSIQEALAEKYATFDQGRVGRGDEELSAAQKERIARCFSYYPDIDFEKYGL